MLPHVQDRPPALAIDAMTGVPYKGLHQLVLGELLAAMAQAVRRTVDPRFITREDADLMTKGIPDEQRDAHVVLRPRFIGTEYGKGRIDAPVVWPVECVPGLDDVSERKTVMAEDLLPNAPSAAILEPDDLTRSGTIGRMLAEVSSSPDAVVVAGIALWIVHGMLVVAMNEDAAEVVDAARSVVDGSCQLPRMCGIANEGQLLANAMIDRLIATKTNGERGLSNLEDRIAIEYSAPCPDLHRAERNCWRFINLRDAAMCPSTTFEAKREICSRMVVDAIEDVGAGERHLAQWIAQAHAASRSCPTSTEVVTVDWGHAAQRDDEAMLRRTEAVERGEAPPIKWKMQGIGPMVHNARPNAHTLPADLIESVHIADSCAMLVGITSTRKEILFAALLLYSPLGRGSCSCDGEDWLPLESSGGAVWYAPKPDQLSPRIGEPEGTKLHFRLHREYKSPSVMNEESEPVHEHSTLMHAFAVLAEGAPADDVWDLGLTPRHSVSGNGDRLLVLSTGTMPKAACILPHNQEFLKLDRGCEVTVGTKTTKWSVERLPNTDLLVVVSQTEDALLGLKGGRASVTMLMNKRQNSTWLFFLEMYEAQMA